MNETLRKAFEGLGEFLREGGEVILIILATLVFVALLIAWFDGADARRQRREQRRLRKPPKRRDTPVGSGTGSNNGTNHLPHVD